MTLIKNINPYFAQCCIIIRWTIIINKQSKFLFSLCRGPRCIARFEYIGDQKDELSFSEGETIILKEYVNEEWAKGELKGVSGIFPLNFVEVIEDLPGTGTRAKTFNKMVVYCMHIGSIQEKSPKGQWMGEGGRKGAKTDENSKGILGLLKKLFLIITLNN